MPAVSSSSRVRASAAVAFAVVAGLAGTIPFAGPASAAPTTKQVATPAASTQQEATAATTEQEQAAPAVRIPATCRAAVTLVRPDTTLALGIVQGTTGTLYDTGRRLGYTPTAIAYLGSTRNRGLTADRFFAVDPAGRLHRIVVVDRPGAAAPTSTDTVVARGWGRIRTMVSSGPYLYALSTSGGLHRYAVTKAYGVVGASTLAARGWGTVTSLAYGGWWNLGRGRVADDIVALTTAGAVNAYSIPRDTPRRIGRHTLKTGGWNVFRHVAVGECARGVARPVVGVKANGDVFAYLDANGNDQKGRDIVAAGRVARGWTGLVAD